MSAASLPFILFTLVLAPLYALAPRAWRQGLLLVASLMFYASFNWGFLPLLVGVIAVTFLAGLSVHAKPDGALRAWLWMGAILAPLIFYKYLLVWFESLRATFVPVSGLDFGGYGAVLIPLGLSFFTFQCLGYVIDVRRGAYAPDRDPLHFGVFVALFPQLLAGPIERYRTLARQIDAAAPPSADMVLDGLLMMSYGVFLKACLGDRLGAFVDAVFAAPAANASLTALMGIYGFTLQLYADFAGYSLIALGAARLLGIELTVNFRQPLFARSIAEFWQGWHISLTRWIGDYLHRPLALWAVRRSAWPKRLQEALTQFVTWTVMGLWHGANLTFVVFGLIQGALMMGHNLRARGRRASRRPLALAGATVVTFHLVALSFGLIRAPSLEAYGALLGAIARLEPGLFVPSDVRTYAPLALGIVVAVDAIARFKTEARLPRSVGLRTLAIAVLVVLVVLTGHSEGTAFIYFRF